MPGNANACWSLRCIFALANCSPVALIKLSNNVDPRKSRKLQTTIHLDVGRLVLLHVFRKMLQRDVGDSCTCSCVAALPVQGYKWHQHICESCEKEKKRRFCGFSGLYLQCRENMWKTCSKGLKASSWTCDSSPSTWTACSNYWTTQWAKPLQIPLKHLKLEKNH